MSVRTVEIRLAERDDLDALITLHAETVLFAYRDWFPFDAAPPDRSQLLRQAADVADCALVAVVDGAIVGSVAARRIGELARLHVHPTRWGERIGGTLHDALGVREVRYQLTLA